MIKPPRVPPSLIPDAVESNIVVTVTTKPKDDKAEEKDDEQKKRKSKRDVLDRHYYVRVHDRPYVGEIEIDDDDDTESIETKMHVLVKVVSLCDMKMYVVFEREA